MTVPLEKLGERICIIGPSSSGKSTLADFLARKKDVPCFHLDQMAHLPNTDWKRKETDDFSRLHEKAVSSGAWVIEGNYRSLMPERFSRATAIVWLDFNVVSCTFYYILRCLKKGTRYGHLEGAPDSFNLDLVRYTLFEVPKNRTFYAGMIRNHFRGTPLVVTSRRELNNHYALWRKNP